MLGLRALILALSGLLLASGPAAPAPAQPVTAPVPSAPEEIDDDLGSALHAATTGHALTPRHRHPRRAPEGPPGSAPGSVCRPHISPPAAAPAPPAPFGATVNPPLHC